MLHLAPQVTETLVYGTRDSHRFTQDSPVLADVWIEYGLQPQQAQDLLLTPRFGSRAGSVSKALRDSLTALRADQQSTDQPEVAYNQVYVATKLTLAEMVQLVLPRTRWWREMWGRTWWRSDDDDLRVDVALRTARRDIVEALTPHAGEHFESPIPEDLIWLMQILGAIAFDPTGAGTAADSDPPEYRFNSMKDLPDPAQLFEAALVVFGKGKVGEYRFGDDWGWVGDHGSSGEDALVHQVNLNRQAKTAVDRSRGAIKADAAQQLFNVDTRDITWAVIDSGVDATHPAFLEGDQPETGFFSRVKKTYDFTRIRHLLDPVRLEEAQDALKAAEGDRGKMEAQLNERGLPDSFLKLVDNEDRGLADRLESLKKDLQDGRSIDWDRLEPFLEIAHDAEYTKRHIPRNPHGTHVAGILGANLEGVNDEVPGLVGICPNIKIYDLRVLDESAENDEFAVLAALQFVQWLNHQKDFYAVHGVNLSLSIRHAVANFACGRTPVCDQCEELSASGVVVVAAAGNEGFLKYQTQQNNKPRITEGYHTVSITDPGNADGVITVGSTHRFMPHTYGVSYFSSRGPTGDGRSKPDLVAPGEKIWSTVPGGGKKRMDGTSMAAPHVSGAAAMLMARHSELVGQPSRIKEILCSTATDLGRERYFQGSGMLDVLRAMQAI